MSVKFVVSVFTVFLAVSRATLVGGPVNADINNPEVQDALQFAAAEYNTQSNSEFISQIVLVIKAQMQVVAGVKYTFTVEMAQTDCKKSESQTDCVVNSDPDIAQARECKLAVWSRPWENSMELIENTC